MVTTRRSTRRALTVEVNSKSSSTVSNRDTLGLVKSAKESCDSFPSPLGPPQSTLDTAHTEPGSGLDDPSLTPPSTGNTPEKPTARTARNYEQKNKPKTSRRQTHVPERAFASVTGSALNPISLLEDSPPLKNRQATKRGIPEPHQFVERHSKLYKQTPVQSRIPPKPANGSMFTGDPRHDVYRMHTAKATSSGWDNNYRQHAQHGVAFGRQYPSPAQYSMQQLRPADHSQWPYGGYEPQRVPLNSLERGFTYNSRDANKFRDNTTAFDNNGSQLAQLTEYTTLLTSMLQAYPHSTDRKRLKAEITVLGSVQNRCLQEWIRSESQVQRQHSSDSAIDLSSESKPTPLTEETKRQQAELKKRKEMDDVVRAHISSKADIWQDGSGMSVADVFRNAPSQLARMDSRPPTAAEE